MLHEDRDRQQESRFWDKDQALSQLQGDEALLREAAEIFLQECPKLRATLRLALADGDARTLARTAHRLKGSVACLAATRVCSVVADLEEIAGRQDFARAAEVLNEVERELDGMQQVLEEFCKVSHEGVSR